jgi:hypothetical protein
MFRKVGVVSVVALTLVLLAGTGFASDKVLKMSTTTSTQSETIRHLHNFSPTHVLNTTG